MNGIEALKALKEGKMVVHYHNKDCCESSTDEFFFYRGESRNYPEIDMHIWSRLRWQWAWTKLEGEGGEYWLKADNFEIVGAKE